MVTTKIFKVMKVLVRYIMYSLNIERAIYFVFHFAHVFLFYCVRVSIVLVVVILYVGAFSN